jgi:hypothetical protein
MPDVADMKRSSGSDTSKLNPVAGKTDNCLIKKQVMRVILPVWAKPMFLYRVIGNILLYQGAKK